MWLKRCILAASPRDVHRCLRSSIAGDATASTTADRLSFEFALPDQAAYETNQQVAGQFGGGGLNDPPLLVVNGSGAVQRVDKVAGAGRAAGIATVTRLRFTSKR